MNDINKALLEKANMTKPVGPVTIITSFHQLFFWKTTGGASASRFKRILNRGLSKVASVYLSYLPLTFGTFASKLAGQGFKGVKDKPNVMDLNKTI